MGKKRIDLTYLIRGKEVAVISMLSNTQYQIREPLKVLLITNKERQLLEGVFTDRELTASIGKKLITAPLDANDNIVKMDKLACVTEVVLSLNELNNLGNKRLSNTLFRCHVIGSEEFITFKSVAPQYKRLKNGSSLS